MKLRVLWLLAGLAGAGVVLGCALAANPEPPTLWLPAPVKDLAATRVGVAVHLHWTMPKNTTDKVALKGDQRAHFCWESTTRPGFDAKACRAAGDGMFAPDKPVDPTVQLPAELTTGAPRAVEFFVELQNHAGKTAGPSNAAWAAAGAAPPAVTGLRLDTQAAGVVLHWAPAAAQAGMVLRIHRALVPQAGAPKADESKGLPPPEEQVLELDLAKSDPGVALDRDASLDHEWKYWVERVEKVSVDGHALEIAGPPSATVTIDAKDVFPPAVPAGLTVVADTEAKALDLSWAPDADADIAGYVVYCRDVTAGGAMERISGKGLVVAPSFSDTAVVAGHQYAYAVSAVDADGNESGQSEQVEEELPQ